MNTAAYYRSLGYSVIIVLDIENLLVRHLYESQCFQTR